MRTQALNKLTARQCKAAPEGMHSDGGGLFLRVKGSRKSWVFRFTPSGTKKKREMGLGSASTVTLAQAREKATEARYIVAGGGDPITARSDIRPKIVADPTLMTFRQATDEFLLSHAKTLTHHKTPQQWNNSLTNYAAKLMPMACADIKAADVFEVVEPIWVSKAETASRVRMRIERVLSFADAKEDRDRSNPASMKGKLQYLLPKHSKVKVVKHYAAVPVLDAPEAFARIWNRRDVVMGNRALTAVILGGFRSGEVRRMEWDDIGAGEITIPAGRMKARRDHTVPLTPFLAAHIAAQPRWNDTRLVFPGREGRPMSDMTLAMAMRRAGMEGFTVHGWRSSFRDWAAQQGWPRELAEHQLSHLVGSAVERAYARDTLVEQRRPMMEAWERYLLRGPTTQEAAN